MKVNFGQSDKTQIIMFSGGYDSTAYMIHFLKNTNLPVHAHHIIMKNAENRHEPEQRAVEKIIPLLKKIREFTYTESGWDYRVPGFFGYDILIAAFIGSIVAGDYLKRWKQCDVIIGVTSNDMAHAPTPFSSFTRQERARAVFDGTFLHIPKRQRPNLGWPLCEKTKSELTAMIPSEIRQHIFTCRTPKENFERCGECKSCKDEANFSIDFKP
jgi:7-cyano-7-deazaguanine synthase in queuosine biosynthesis